MLRKKQVNKRVQVCAVLALTAALLCGVLLVGLSLGPAAYAPDYAAKLLAPSPQHPFGTDYLGRDMLARTLRGLATSMVIGLLAAAVSSVIALVLGLAAALAGDGADRCICWLVDLCMGLPHLILLLLLSFLLGGGLRGVTVGIALTHWPGLTRVVRAQAMQVRGAQYVQAAAKLGKSRLWIARRHILPHVLPQYLVGLVLLFPHAILHEAAVTFLGYGLPLDTPAVGVILAEAMQHLAAGSWWLAVFPGLALLAVVLLFDAAGGRLNAVLSPRMAQE